MNPVGSNFLGTGKQTNRFLFSIIIILFGGLLGGGTLWAPRKKQIIYLFGGLLIGGIFWRLRKKQIIYLAS